MATNSWGSLSGSTNNKTPVEPFDKLRIGSPEYLPSTLCTYRKKIRENNKRISCPLFFGVDLSVVFSCFPSLLGIKSLTHKLDFTGNGVLASAKIPNRWTSLVKNYYSV